MRENKESNSEATANKIILEAEKFRVNVNASKGKHEEIREIRERINIPHEWADLRKNDDDDDFFHVTCHVDANLKVKIERGEYIDLERLLSKDNNFRTHDEHKIELVNRGGNTYFAPVHDKEARITGIRKWEQAFRIYVAIYTKVNPERCTEIWQYVHVINTAAMSYSWDNVSSYDSTFRQLMAQKPWRS